VASAEEGFTELAAIQHAPEFFDAMGVGGRQVDFARRATMSEYARRLQDPQRILDGNAWGIYPAQTKWAYMWCGDVAMSEAGARVFTAPSIQPRIVELADEVNRQGPAGKMATMADQVARTYGMALTTGEQLRVAQAIQAQWITQMDGHSETAYQGAAEIMNQVKSERIADGRYP
jgi:hypothetical protein